MQERILVTGGGGFVGSHLARHLYTVRKPVRVNDGLIENTIDIAGKISINIRAVNQYRAKTVQVLIASTQNLTYSCIKSEPNNSRIFCSSITS